MSLAVYWAVKPQHTTTTTTFTFALDYLQKTKKTKTKKQQQKTKKKKTTTVCEPRHGKTNTVTVRPAKTQISLGIRLV